MSRSPTDVFRNPRTPGRRRPVLVREGGEATEAKPNGHDTSVDGWIKRAHLNSKGHLQVNLHNSALILREDAQFEGLLGWDEMARTVCVLRAVPEFEEKCPAGQLTDLHAGTIQQLLQRKGLRTLGAIMALQAITDAAHDHPFHPVRDWLDGLTWDGEPRLDLWMHHYLGAADTPYTRAIARCFLIGMVARVFEPGCKSDHMIVLEHIQGARKSTACKVLAGGDEWFSDTMPPIRENTDHVRISMHLRGKWLIEIAEMSAMRRAETDDLKQFLTVTTEKFTAKFARTEGREPRQCLFIGTTNKPGAYLKDETGGRRFWPVKCGRIDTDGLATRRCDLFAEAVAAFKAGEAWWPEAAFEREHFSPEQEARFDSDPWQKPVADWLDLQPDFNGDPPRPQVVWVTDCAYKALTIEAGRQTPEINRRITAILDKLGWVRITIPRNKHGIPWKRGPEAAPYEPPEMTWDG